MFKTHFKPVTHLSIVWGVALVFMTLVEWRGLDRDPLGQEILSPFISRQVALNVSESRPLTELDFEEPEQFGEEADSGLEYAVDIKFNGPLFLACFFGPVLVIHGIGLIAARLRGS